MNPRLSLALVAILCATGCSHSSRHEWICLMSIDVVTCIARPGCSCEPVADPESCDYAEVCGRDGGDVQPVPPGGGVAAR